MEKIILSIILVTKSEMRKFLKTKAKKGSLLKINNLSMIYNYYKQIFIEL